MIKTTAMLLEELREYGSPKSKLARMAERGECFPITRGLYETDRNAPAYLLAGSIYGPSYISFEYALSRYGLIPEAVYAVTCATFEKKKKKKYETPFGTFTYRDVPSEAFPLGLRLVQEVRLFLSDRRTGKGSVRPALYYAARAEHTGAFPAADGGFAD